MGKITQLQLSQFRVPTLDSRKKNNIHVLSPNKKTCLVVKKQGFYYIQTDIAKTCLHMGSDLAVLDEHAKGDNCSTR